MQRSAVRCRAVRCCAVLCGAVPCCPVLRASLYLYLVRARYHSKYHAKYRYCYTRLVRTSFVNHKNALPAQLRSAIAQQRVRCRALPCGTVRCCRPALYFIRTSRTGYYAKYQVPGTGMYVCTSLAFVLCLASLVLSTPFVFPANHLVHPYCRSECSIANKHKAQQRAISSAYLALGIIKSLVAPIRAPLFFAPFAFSCVLRCAHVAKPLYPLATSMGVMFFSRVIHLSKRGAGVARGLQR